MLKETSTFAGLDSAFAGAYQQAPLDGAISRAKDRLLSLQSKEGYWVFELEADCTIPVRVHPDDALHGRDRRGPCRPRSPTTCAPGNSMDGSYPLFQGGIGDISCTVKAYYALKMAGDSIDAPHMKKAREWILAQGGAAKANVFTRIMLAMFEQIPWRGVPFIPVEIMLLPKWFPFHLDKVSYWSRTVMVPLFILCSYKVKARNPA